MNEWFTENICILISVMFISLGNPRTYRTATLKQAHINVSTSKKSTEKVRYCVKKERENDR